MQSLAEKRKQELREAGIGHKPSMLAKIKAMTDEALMQRFNELAQFTAAQIIEMAAIWHELERRGSLPEDLKRGIWSRFLPRVFHKQVSPELYPIFVEMPSLYRRIATLPLKEQKDLALKGAVEIKRGEGVIEQVPLESLSERDFDRVFKDGRLISGKDQKTPLEHKAEKRVERKVIAVSMTTAEYEALRLNAELSGRSVEDFVTLCIAKEGGFRSD